jgi:hypothetical protein
MVTSMKQQVESLQAQVSRSWSASTPREALLQEAATFCADAQ